MSEIRKLIGEALAEIVSDARSGGPRISVGLMAMGSELGAEELAGEQGWPGKIPPGSKWS